MSRLTIVVTVLAGLLAVLVAAPPAQAAVPDTTITSGPEDGALVLPGPVTYTFTSDPNGDPFECSVDNAPFAACVSPVTYDLGFGGHILRVRAVDGVTPDPTPAHRIWTVRNVACEQAGDAYRAAQAHYFLDESKLSKAKVKYHKVKRHGNAAQVRRARHKLDKAKKAAKQAKAAFDAASAHQDAVC
jgi:hypothetical protein